VEPIQNIKRSRCMTGGTKNWWTVTMMMMSEPEQRSLSHNTLRTNMSALIITLKVRQWDAAIADCCSGIIHYTNHLQKAQTMLYSGRAWEHRVPEIN
jgi:hypothetical protein